MIVVVAEAQELLPQTSLSCCASALTHLKALVGRYIRTRA
jgi:hypothetical protein